jgi:hypothetical protein
MCAQLYIFCLRELCRRRRLAKVNLRLIPVLIISLPATKTPPPPPSARSSFSLALCADDKMCPRGFETFSLRERELETAASLLQNAINATTKVLRAAPPLTISNVAPCETFN